VGAKAVAAVVVVKAAAAGAGAKAAAVGVVAAKAETRTGKAAVVAEVAAKAEIRIDSSGVRHRAGLPCRHKAIIDRGEVGARRTSGSEERSHFEERRRSAPRCGLGWRPRCRRGEFFEANSSRRGSRGHCGSIPLPPVNWQIPSIMSHS
jgi:hypothetical protein